MNIQFECYSCRQPIEIDGEWAGKEVICPYCRKTVRAPEQSTYTPPNEAPTAHPAGGPTPYQQGQQFQGQYSPAQPGGPPVAGELYEPRNKNTLALTALILAILAMGATIGHKIVVAPHAAELQEAVAPEEAQGFAEMLDNFSKKYPDGLPGWLLAANALMLAAIVFWIVGIILGLIALRNSDRRNLNILSLVILGLVPVSCCLPIGM